MRLGETILTSELPTKNEPVKAGEYRATIEKVEVKETSKKTGFYLSIQWKLENGRMVFDMINFRNQNEVAERIGRQQLGQLLNAAGLHRLDDTDQLVGAACRIKVGIQESDGYDPKNIVNSYAAIAGSPLPKPAAAAADTQELPPWKR